MKHLEYDHDLDHDFQSLLFKIIPRNQIYLLSVITRLFSYSGIVFRMEY